MNTRAVALGGLVLAMAVMPGVASAERPAAPVTEDDDGDGQPNIPDPAVNTENRHPSGNDKTEENGRSGNQGRSGSAPDEDGHGPDRDEGGIDKPGGPGGLFFYDQDGNNGCGNDDDFEDDNEGWCGKPPSETETSGDQSSDEGDTSVAEFPPLIVDSFLPPSPTPRTASSQTVVAAASVVAAAPSVGASSSTVVESLVLGRTGVDLGVPVLGGIALVLFGLLERRLRPRERRAQARM